MAKKLKKTIEPLKVNGTLMALDLSTTSTGGCIYKERKFYMSWLTKPCADDIPGLSTMKYPEGVYRRMLYVAEQMAAHVKAHKPDVIVIEEVNRGINRIAQKGLDALHFFVLDAIVKVDPEYIHKIKYVDSNGTTGWRGVLGLRLSEEDKEYNKKTKLANKKTKLQKPIIDWKVLAQRYVNKRYGFDFDVWENKEDADVCDAICLACAFFETNP